MDTIIYEATVWSQQSSGTWEMTVLQGLESHIDIAEIGVNLPFAEIYDRIIFPPDLRVVRPA